MKQETHTRELFDDLAHPPPRQEQLREGACVLRGFAQAEAPVLLEAITAVIEQAPLRQMTTPGGLHMSVAMSNCGALGWVTDRRGYRYDRIDPDSGRPWPAMPAAFTDLATRAAAAAGFRDFVPDACLINRYQPGTRLSLHQDRDERDYAQPIVSVSLGLSARFQFGGLRRAERPLQVPLFHGDVVVWGGTARLAHHGVLPLQDGIHPATGACRFNLTFRRAG
jgi:DNA oxidative demethylase